MVSFDFDRDWHAECRKGVDAPCGDSGFGNLGVAVAGSQVGSDDGFVAGHRGFGEGSSVVAGPDFPRLGPDLGDAALASGGTASPRVFGASFSLGGGVMAAPVFGGMTGLAPIASIAGQYRGPGSPGGRKNCHGPCRR